jgi:Cdc6-like AAA superfamily ATPase
MLILFSNISTEKKIPYDIYSYPPYDRSSLVSRKDSQPSDTVSQIVAHQHYNSWFTANQSQILWLYGEPEIGKTMTAVDLTFWLEKEVSKPGTVIYFFCINSAQKKPVDAEGIVGGLIRLLQEMQPTCANHNRKNVPAHNTFEALWEIFEKMLQNPECGEVYCILDGLDECEERSARNLLVKFREIFLSKQTNRIFKLIITSRVYPTIAEKLSPFPKIELGQQVGNVP